MAQRDPNGPTPPALVKEAMGAFNLLREYFEGAIMVDAQARITWMDRRYRRLLNVAPISIRSACRSRTSCPIRCCARLWKRGGRSCSTS